MGEARTKVSEVAVDRLAVKRIEPAYRQVADQLRNMILSGALAGGEQLPTEDKLGARFGVSRNTVREALRMLSSLDLVETTRGVSGGTFVTRPQPEILQRQLATSLRFLNGVAEIDQRELSEARDIIEIPSARAAAQRRTEADLERIRNAAGMLRSSETLADRTIPNQEFHQAILDAAGNRLLSMITPPIWAALNEVTFRSDSRSHWAQIDHDHTEILCHIEAQRPDEAAEAMRIHLLHIGELQH